MSPTASLASVASYWEHEPRVLDQPIGTDRFDAQALFDLVCRASAVRSELPDPQDVRVFADDLIVNPSLVADYLPSAERDRTFADYAGRLLDRTRSFALTVNSLQQFDWDVWRALREHVDPVLEANDDWAAGGVDCHLIASVYDTAPTRVHKDTAGVFTHIVEGHKRYYVWEYDQFAAVAGPDSLQRQVNLPAEVRVEDHLDTATTVEGGPGSLLYWPSDRWHCATADGWALSVHVAHYRWDDRLEAIVRRLRRQATTRLGAARFSTEVGGSVEVDADVERVLSDVLATGLATGDSALRGLKRRTASNFEVVPPLRAQPELGADDVLVVPRVSVVRTLDLDGTRFVGVNGHVVRIAGGAWLDDFLPQLQPADGATVGDWCRRVATAGGPGPADGARQWLGQLVARGALDVVRGDG